MMDRERLREALVDLVDGTLAPDEARAAKEALAAHPDLEREYADLRRAVELAGALPPLDMPEALTARIGEAVDRASASGGASSIGGASGGGVHGVAGLRLIPWIAGLAAALVIGLVAIRIFGGPSMPAPARDEALLDRDAADEPRQRLAPEDADAEESLEAEEAEEEDEAPLRSGDRSGDIERKAVGAFKGDVPAGSWNNGAGRRGNAGDRRRAAKSAARSADRGDPRSEAKGLKNDLRTKGSGLERARGFVAGAKGGKGAADETSNKKRAAPAKSVTRAMPAPAVRAPRPAQRIGEPEAGGAADKQPSTGDEPVAKRVMKLDESTRSEDSIPPAPAAAAPKWSGIAHAAKPQVAPIDDTVGTLAVRVDRERAPEVRAALREFLRSRSRPGRAVPLTGALGGRGRPALGLEVLLTDAEVAALERLVARPSDVVASARWKAPARVVPRERNRPNEHVAGFAGRVRKERPPRGAAGYDEAKKRARSGLAPAGSPSPGSATSADDDERHDRGARPDREKATPTEMAKSAAPPAATDAKSANSAKSLKSAKAAKTAKTGQTAKAAKAATPDAGKRNALTPRTDPGPRRRWILFVERK